jgi:uncharacterized protein YcnI
MTKAQAHIRSIAWAAACLLATTAAAEVYLSPKTARVGSRYTATLSLSGDCNGKSTRSVAVWFPVGFLDAEAKSKPGWTLRRILRQSTHPGERAGETTASSVAEFVWETGSIEAGEYDEFVFRGTFARDLQPKQRLYFPTIQTCDDGSVVAWIDKAGEVTDGRHKSMPAPFVALMEFNGLKLQDGDRTRIAGDE